MMYLKEEKIYKNYTRISKLGNLHQYSRTELIAFFRCDNCFQVFTRPRQYMSPRRLNNNYFHCCENCNAKMFAQRKGVERRKIWDMPASSELNISRI